MTGEFTLRHLEHAFVNYFLSADMEHMPLSDEQKTLLKAIRAHRGNLERRGWESHFRWSWWRHPILAFRQWRARSTPPPRDEDVAALAAQMPRLARVDAERERLAKHGIARDTRRAMMRAQAAPKITGWHMTTGRA